MFVNVEFLSKVSNKIIYHRLLAKIFWIIVLYGLPDICNCLLCNPCMGTALCPIQVTLACWEFIQVLNLWFRLDFTKDSNLRDEAFLFWDTDHKCFHEINPGKEYILYIVLILSIYSDALIIIIESSRKLKSTCNTLVISLEFFKIFCSE